MKKSILEKLQDVLRRTAIDESTRREIMRAVAIEAPPTTNFKVEWDAMRAPLQHHLTIMRSNARKSCESIDLKMLRRAYIHELDIANRAIKAKAGDYSQPVPQGAKYWQDWIPTTKRNQLIDQFRDVYQDIYFAKRKGGRRMIPFITKELLHANALGYTRVLTDIMRERHKHLAPGSRSKADTPMGALMLFALKQAEARIEDEGKAIKAEDLHPHTSRPKAHWLDYCDAPTKRRVEEALAGGYIDTDKLDQYLILTEDSVYSTPVADTPEYQPPAHRTKSPMEIIEDIAARKREKQRANNQLSAEDATAIRALVGNEWKLEVLSETVPKQEEIQWDYDTPEQIEAMKQRALARAEARRLENSTHEPENASGPQGQANGAAEPREMTIAEYLASKRR